MSPRRSCLGGFAWPDMVVEEENNLHVQVMHCGNCLESPRCGVGDQGGRHAVPAAIGPRV